jgi:hypothetical protein
MKYLRDFGQPFLYYCIAMSILYLHYHQARLYRQIALNLEKANIIGGSGAGGGLRKGIQSPKKDSSSKPSLDHIEEEN